MDGLRWAREEESRASRERAEAQRAALTRQLREREDELEAQRADSAEAFDRIMQQRQEEMQARWEGSGGLEKWGPADRDGSRAIYHQSSSEPQ